MAKHCCDRMDYDLDQVCSHHPDRFDCPDALVHFEPDDNSFGLIVHDGSSSHIEIAFCPWCGSALTKKSD